MVLWILIDILNFSISHILKFRQYKNVNIANFVYYGKTRLDSVNSGNSENLRNHWGMNWVQYKVLLSCLWLCGWVVESLSLTHEVLGSNPVIFLFYYLQHSEKNPFLQSSDQSRANHIIYSWGSFSQISFVINLVNLTPWDNVASCKSDTLTLHNEKWFNFQLFNLTQRN